MSDSRYVGRLTVGGTNDIPRRLVEEALTEFFHSRGEFVGPVTIEYLEDLDNERAERIKDEEQCPSYSPESGNRCDLPAGHREAHVARINESLLCSWGSP